MPEPDMRYVDHGAGGPAEVMRVVRGPRPRPGAGELLIEVAYAGVNRADVMQRAGNYPPPADASPVLGLEVAGRCAAVAAECRRFSVGDAVCALVPGGGYAEYCVAPESHCLPIPRGWTLEQAATLPEVCFTVWANVFEMGALRAGEALLVHGGSSGIGVLTIQLAKALGARVATTVGSARKRAFCETLGADLVVNYREQDFVDVVHEAWGHVDVILDMIGGDYTARNLQLLARGGRLVQIAMMGGRYAKLDLARVVGNRLTVTGSGLRTRSVAEKAEIARALEEKVWPLLEAGRIRAVIDATWPLDEVVAAHRALESSEHIGKIVLAVAPEGAQR